MGIPNFTLLLKSNTEIKNFDSIFIDAQSLLYVAIEVSLKEKESDFIKDICLLVVAQLGKILSTLFNTKQLTDKVEVIISFDGDGVPMKWPTQQKRREIEFKGRNVYKISLFGNNLISQNTYKYVLETLQNFQSFRKYHLRCLNVPNIIRFTLSGCNLEGEGEHKLFHLGKHCKNPVIVSEDNDIFILSYLHYKHFESIQVQRKSNAVYHLNDLCYDPKILVLASLLFGNDFIPPVVSISENNFNTIHDILTSCNGDMVSIFHHVLTSLLEKHKLRYVKVPFIEFQAIVNFFKTCIWMLDYYTKQHFPQKYMQNEIFNNFDRNMIVTALLDIDYSKSAYETAKKEYYKTITTPQRDSVTNVFNQDQFSIVKRFFTDIDDKDGGHVIEIKLKL